MSLKDKIVNLIFRGTDELSDPAEEAAQSLEELEKSSKDLSAELKKTTAQQKQIDKFKELSATLDVSETNMKSTALAADKLAKELGQAGTPTKEMADALEKAEQEASAAEKAFKSNQNAVAKMSAKVEATIAPISELGKKETELKTKTKALGEELSAVKTDLKSAGSAAKNAGNDAAESATDWTELKSKITLVGAAVVGALAGLNAFLTGAGNSEYAVNKLTSALKRTTDATDDEIAALHQQAEALQTVTRFTDEETRAAQTKLAHYQLSASTIAELTPALLDMAEAKRESGDADADTIGAAEAIGDAMRENITVLESFGVHVTDATEEQFKMAGEAERLEIIMQHLNKSFGGAAEAAGQTWAGAVDIAKNKTNESLESLASLITENETIKRVLGDASQAFTDMADAILRQSPTIELAISAIATQFGWLLDAGRLMANGLQASWDLVTIAILELEKTAVKAWASINEALGNDEAANGARQLAAVIDDQLKKAYEDLEQNGKDVTDTFKTMASRGEELVDTLQGVTTETKEVTGAQGQLSTATGKTTEKLGEQGKAADTQTAKVKSYFASLGLSMDLLSTGVDQNTNDLVNNFGEIITEVLKTETTTKGLANVMGPVLAKTLEGITTPEGLKLLDEKINEVTKSSGNMAGKIMGVTNEALLAHDEKLKDTGENTDYVSQRYARWAEQLEETAELMDGAGESADESGEKIKEMGDKAADAANAPVEASNAAKETVSSAGALIADIFNAASSQLYGLSEAAGQAFEANMGRGVVSGTEYFSSQAAAAFDDLNRSMNRVTTDGISKYINSVAVAAHKTRAEFYTQAAAAEKIGVALESTETPSLAMIEKAERATDKFGLLDESTLSGLRSQIESARASIESLETSAQQTYESINDRLFNAKGEYVVAVRADYDRELRQLQEELEYAKQWRSQEAVENLENSIRALKELANIEIAAAQDRERSERENRERSASEVIDVNLNLGGETVRLQGDPGGLNQLRRYNRTR